MALEVRSGSTDAEHDRCGRVTRLEHAQLDKICAARVHRMDDARLELLAPDRRPSIGWQLIGTIEPNSVEASFIGCDASEVQLARACFECISDEVGFPAGQSELLAPRCLEAQDDRVRMVRLPTPRAGTSRTSVIGVLPRPARISRRTAFCRDVAPTIFVVTRETFVRATVGGGAAGSCAGSESGAGLSPSRTPGVAERRRGSQ